MTIEQLCNEVLELDEKATKGPWFTTDPNGDGQLEVFSKPHNSQVAYGAFNVDVDMVAHYRSAAPKLAKACLVMLKQLRALEKGNYPRCGCDELAKTTLAEVEKIVGGKWLKE